MTTKKKKRNYIVTSKPVTVEIEYSQGVVVIENEDDAIRYLEEMDRITSLIKPILEHQSQIKKEVTRFGVLHKAKVFQLDDAYYRLIQRTSSMWVSTPSEMPKPKPKGAKSVREIVGDRMVKVDGKTKKLWNVLTKRVFDTNKLDEAINNGWISEDEISKAYIGKSQAPYYQRFEGEASD